MSNNANIVRITYGRDTRGVMHALCRDSGAMWFTTPVPDDGAEEPADDAWFETKRTATGVVFVKRTKPRWKVHLS